MNLLNTQALWMCEELCIYICNMRVYIYVTCVKITTCLCVCLDVWNDTKTDEWQWVYGLCYDAHLQIHIICSHPAATHNQRDAAPMRRILIASEWIFICCYNAFNACAFGDAAANVSVFVSHRHHPHQHTRNTNMAHAHVRRMVHTHVCISRHTTYSVGFG